MDRARAANRPSHAVDVELAREVRARAWEYAFAQFRQRESKEAATSPESRYDDATVRNIEEVSDVGRQNQEDQPSRISDSRK